MTPGKPLKPPAATLELLVFLERATEKITKTEKSLFSGFATRFVSEARKNIENHN